MDVGVNKIGPTGATAIADALRVNEVLTNLDLSGNNIGGETDYIKASEVEGESKQVGAMVIYEGREMVVSQGVDSDGDLTLRDTAGVLAIAKALEVNEGADQTRGGLTGCRLLHVVSVSKTLVSGAVSSHSPAPVHPAPTALVLLAHAHAVFEN